MKLDPEDAAKLIDQTRSENTILIGGQAVAFWRDYYKIESSLPALTDDIDYLGTKAEAKRVSARLKIPHSLKIATFDDNTPNSAVVAVELEGYPEPVLIDYLATVIGVESKAIEKSAVVAEFEGDELRVIHPMQLLQTKIWNLYRLAEKRTPEGIEQARLAIAVVAAFIAEANMGRRELLNAIEAIGKFAATDPARFAADTYKLDCLEAIPQGALESKILPEEFRAKRWPQILASATRR